jgi:hypothetical protein
LNDKLSVVDGKNQKPELGDLEKVLIGGDLSRLSEQQAINYYSAVCAATGLNPVTRPFEFLLLSGKKVLYAKKDATDQLRKINRVSVKITGREKIGDVFMVTAQAFIGERFDESIGAVNILGIKGDAMANALMKAETKAKRRVTLSICGLGMLDETEIETIPDARKLDDSSLNTKPVEPKVISEQKKPASPPPKPKSEEMPKHIIELFVNGTSLGFDEPRLKQLIKDNFPAISSLRALSQKDCENMILVMEDLKLSYEDADMEAEMEKFPFENN